MNPQHENFKHKVKQENSSDIDTHEIKQDKTGLKIGVIGGGFVGGSVARFFKEQNADVKVYDKFKPMDSLSEMKSQDYIFIAVPTPYDGDKIDLSIVDDAFSNLHGVTPRAVIIKSTVIPGSTEFFQKKYPHLKVLFNPEFLTESTAYMNFCYPDRQIIGYTEQSFSVAAEVLALLPLAPYSKVMSASAAEMVKYFGNTWFSTKVVFANQMYDLCESIGVDYYQVADAAGADRRIGRSHLDVVHDGYRGYSGKCLPKDTRALIAFGKEHGVKLEILEKVEEINNKLVADNKK